MRVRDPRDVQRDLALAVAARVLQQVAQGAAQQPGVAVDFQRAACAVHVLRAVVAPAAAGTAGTQFGIDAGALLGGQAQQIDALEAVAGKGAGVQPAGQQDFIDQLIELGDVALDLGARGAQVGAAVQQLQAHADARQRRAQLVRGIGQQRLVRCHQRLNARCRGVEALRQACHLVVSLFVYARRQVALAKALHAAFELLQALQQAPDDGEQGHAHGQSGQRQRPGEAIGRAQPEGCAAALVAWRSLARRQAQAVGLAVLGLDAQLQAGFRLARDACGQALQQHAAIGRQQLQLAPGLGLQALGVVLGSHAPGVADDQREHRQAGGHSQPDAQVQAPRQGAGGAHQGHGRTPSTGAVSPAGAQRHSLRRAP